MAHKKRTGPSECTARLRKAEGWNHKRLALPVVHEYEDERTECQCRKPQDNDQGVCLGCGYWIAYGART